jgi:hypothetical protein
VTDRPIRLILDTSAVVAFTRDETAIHVGEKLVMIAEERVELPLSRCCARRQRGGP